MAYFDLDDVLCDGSEVPCRFLHTVPGLGFLDGRPGGTVTAGTTLRLPLWLAQILAVVVAGGEGEEGEGEGEEGDNNTPFVEMQVPGALGPKVLAAVRADPVALDVHAVQPHFYALALRWCALYADQDLARQVAGLLLQRAQEINGFAVAGGAQGGNTDSSNGASITASSPFLATLDEWEKGVYRDAQRARRDASRWSR